MLRALLLASALLPAFTPAATAQVNIWRLNPVNVNLQDRPGDTNFLVCPPGEPPSRLLSMDGTGTYGSASAISYAAVHDGLITYNQGGRVEYEILYGDDPIPGSTQNGLTTNDLTWEGFRYTFIGVTPYIPPTETELAAQAAAVQGDWTVPMDGLNVDVTPGTELSVYCPPNIGFPDRGAAGTDLYSGESNVCAAAIHRGLFRIFEGGLVSLIALGPQPQFFASHRNRQHSFNGGPYPSSFVFILPDEESP